MQVMKDPHHEGVEGERQRRDEDCAQLSGGRLAQQRQEAAHLKSPEVQLDEYSDHGDSDREHSPGRRFGVGRLLKKLEIAT